MMTPRLEIVIFNWGFRQWRTAREEEIRFRERMKRFIRKEFQIEKAEYEAKRVRRQRREET